MSRYIRPGDDRVQTDPGDLTPLDRRRLRVAADRAAMTKARQHGLSRRHATKLRAVRSGDPTTREESSS